MSDKKPSRGFQGAVLKLLRAGDYELTVTGRREISRTTCGCTSRPASCWPSGRCTRRCGSAGGSPTATSRISAATRWSTPIPRPAPWTSTSRCTTAWPRGGRRTREPGDTLEVTVLGSNFTLPEPAPRGYVIVGDTASLPAINSLLTAIGDAPARVFLEAGHDDDKQLPVARSADVTWVDRKNAGEALVEAVSLPAFDASDHFGWVACDNRTTRAVAKVFREDYEIPRKSIKAQAYWVA